MQPVDVLRGYASRVNVLWRRSFAHNFFVWHQHQDADDPGDIRNHLIPGWNHVIVGPVDQPRHHKLRRPAEYGDAQRVEDGESARPHRLRKRFGQEGVGRPNPNREHECDQDR